MVNSNICRLNLAAGAEIYAILTDTVVHQHVYRETCLRLTLLQKFSAVNIKIIWSQMYILPFNAFRNIFHPKVHLANVTVVTYYSTYFQPCVCVYLPSLDLLLYFPIMLWLSPQKLTFDKHDSLTVSHCIIILFTLVQCVLEISVCRH